MQTQNKTDESKLRVFFADVTSLGENATTYLINRTEHILAVVETHLLGEKSPQEDGGVQPGGMGPHHVAGHPVGRQ